MTSTRPESSPERDQAVQMLRDLGLTGTEAEVYFAALQACGTEPVSSYRLAQLMGRDPANVAKTIASLVRQQAMSVVQDKPRLFQPADPADFNEHVQAHLKQRGQAAVALLGRCHSPLPEGLTLGLASPEQVYTKARELLSGCRQRAQVFGSKEALREIGAELEELAGAPGRAVHVLSPVAMVADNVEISVFDGAELADLASREFLHLVVDDRAWLSARLDLEPGPQPVGWWADHAPMAGILAGCLSLARQSCREPVSGPMATPEPWPDPAPPPVVADESEFQEGITFLQRHSGPPSDPAIQAGKGSRIQEEGER